MKRYWYAAYQNNPRGHTNVDEFLGVGKITFFSFPSEDAEKAGKAFLTRMEDLDLQDYCPCCGSSFSDYVHAGPLETLEEVQEAMADWDWATPKLVFNELLG